MQPSNTEPTADAQHGSTTGISRRSLLKTSATAVVGAAGVGAATSSGAAQWFGGSDVPELDFRGGNPSLSEAPVDDDVVFYAHGYTGSGNSVGEASDFATTAQDVGYDGSVAAMTWDDGGGPILAEQSGRETGRRMAEYVENYIDQNPDTNVRTLGYSMGGFVVMELVGALSEYRIENADMIGSYEVGDAPCEGNFYSAIENNVAFMGNYYSTNDSIARLGSGEADCGGFFGGGDTPSTYHDVDVSGSVGSHVSYKSSRGCVEQIVGNYGDEISRGGSGSGGSGTSGSDTTGGGWFGSGDSGGSGLWS